MVHATWTKACTRGRAYYGCGGRFFQFIILMISTCMHVQYWWPSESRSIEWSMSDNSPESGGSRSSLESYGSVSMEELLSSPNLKMLEVNDQVRELQTIVRDRWVETYSWHSYIQFLSLHKLINSPNFQEYVKRWFYILLQSSGEQWLDINRDSVHHVLLPSTAAFF